VKKVLCVWGVLTIFLLNERLLVSMLHTVVSLNLETSCTYSGATQHKRNRNRHGKDIKILL
jgi:hypothetical protein